MDVFKSDLYSKLQEILVPSTFTKSNQNLPFLNVDYDALERIKRTLEDVRKHDPIKTTQQMPEELAEKSILQKQVYNPEDVKQKNQMLLKEFQSKINSEPYQNMLKERQRLPAWEMKETILAAVAKHQVIIVSGMTGCGKTTQVPQFILDEALHSENFDVNIICTQPRRISAIAVAERVSQERHDILGKFVGYQIRLDSDTSMLTRLLFCTTGIVLRRLESDPDLNGVTHIIVDEVHERSELSDFLILILKKLLERRPDLKVILMSATIDAQLFSDYFGHCPVIDIPGKPFPVKQYFLEDVIEKINYSVGICSEYARSSSDIRSLDYRYGHQMTNCDIISDSRLSESQLRLRYPKHSNNTVHTLINMDVDKINYELLVRLLEWIVLGDNKEEPSDRAILVFLPGYQEIQTLYDLLQQTREFNINKEKYIFIPLHSSFSSEEQKTVFLRPVSGVRKIVLSTNIAETSVTIDDIYYVIDSGKMKEMRYDHSKSMQSLETIWVSKTNAVQRMGRAGRVQEGVCFHLFTSHMYQHELREHPIPEIQRNSLEQVVIRTKILAIFKDQDIELVLQHLINPPSVENIHGAVQRLKNLGALDSKLELTALGYHVGSLPVDVRIGKLMLYGTIFRCVDSVLTIAACLSYKSPFISPFKKKEEASAKKKELASHRSDILTMLKAYNNWWEERKSGSQSAYNYCREYFLSYKTIEMLVALKQQYVELLSDIGFIVGGLRIRDVQAAASNNSDGVARITGEEVNVNNDNEELLSALLIAALYPNIIQTVSGQLRKVPGGGRKFKTKAGELVDIHPGSVNYKFPFELNSFLVYHEKVKTKKVYIRDCSLVSNLSLMIFAGSDIQVSDTLTEAAVIIDDMIKFRVQNKEIGDLLKSLRAELNHLLSDKISDPYAHIFLCYQSQTIINCIVHVISNCY